MIGLGTIVNVGTVLIGTTIGILLKNGLPKRFEKTVMQGLGPVSYTHLRSLATGCCCSSSLRHMDSISRSLRSIS